MKRVFDSYALRENSVSFGRDERIEWCDRAGADEKDHRLL
jgi:hypothetical protein